MLVAINDSDGESSSQDVCRTNDKRQLMSLLGPNSLKVTILSLDYSKVKMLEFH